MKTNFAVYHVEKGKSSAGGIGCHIDRKGSRYSHQHANPDKAHLNEHFKVNAYCEYDLNKAIEERLKDGYTGKKALRKDAVKFCTHILTGSHEEMIEIFSNEQRKREWLQANYDFLCNEFGGENIIRFTLHLDEKTPHIHAVTVPLTPDGRLSAKEVLGNPKVFQERQDRYAEAMHRFGLERGIKRAGVKHESAKEYYERINQAQKIINEDNSLDQLDQYKTILGVKAGLDKEKTIKAHKEAILSLKTAVIEEQERLKRKERELLSDNSWRTELIERGKNYTNLEENYKWLKNTCDNLTREKKVLEREKEEMRVRYIYFKKQLEIILPPKKEEEEEQEKKRGFRLR